MNGHNTLSPKSPACFLYFKQKNNTSRTHPNSGVRLFSSSITSIAAQGHSNRSSFIAMQASNAGLRQLNYEETKHYKAKLEQVQNFMKMLTYLIIIGHAERAIHLVRTKYSSAHAPTFTYSAAQLIIFRAHYGQLHPVHEALDGISNAVSNSTVKDLQHHLNQYDAYKNMSSLDGMKHTVSTYPKARPSQSLGRIHHNWVRSR